LYAGTFHEQNEENAAEDEDQNPKTEAGGSRQAAVHCAKFRTETFRGPML
jgi:hypothetical protein